MNGVGWGIGEGWVWKSGGVSGKESEMKRVGECGDIGAVVWSGKEINGEGWGLGWGMKVVKVA